MKNKSALRKGSKEIYDLATTVAVSGRPPELPKLLQNYPRWKEMRGLLRTTAVNLVSSEAFLHDCNNTGNHGKHIPMVSNELHCWG